MTRYKGRQSAKAIEHAFPHFVDVAVPLGGLGEKLNTMYEFHARHGTTPRRGHGQRSYEGSVICWRFADQTMATAFAREFTVK